MGRWRPPPPKSSPYITAAGYKQLEGELSVLWQRRKTVTNAITAAAAEGDRSENAEYIYRKKELREIDRRIRYLQKRMPVLNIVSEVGDKNRIFFGATVTVENNECENFIYKIVGPDEIESESGCISIDSPMAKSLLGKTINDEIIVKAGPDESCYYIKAIHYN